MDTHHIGIFKVQITVKVVANLSEYVPTESSMVSIKFVRIGGSRSQIMDKYHHCLKVVQVGPVDHP